MRSSLKRLRLKIEEINHRYREPRIEMSRGVRAALQFLRFYLMFLVCLIAYKFILLLS